LAVIFKEAELELLTVPLEGDTESQFPPDGLVMAAVAV
jgi:hypothetical protein